MMRRSYFVRLGSLVLAMALSSASIAQAQDVGLKVGASAPAVTVETLDGAKVDLASYFERDGTATVCASSALPSA
jgi:hypothetical protein